MFKANSDKPTAGRADGHPMGADCSARRPIVISFSSTSIHSNQRALRQCDIYRPVGVNRFNEQPFDSEPERTERPASDEAGQVSEPSCSEAVFLDRSEVPVIANSEVPPDRAERNDEQIVAWGVCCVSA